MLFSLLQSNPVEMLPTSVSFFLCIIALLSQRKLLPYYSVKFDVKINSVGYKRTNQLGLFFGMTCSKYALTAW